MKPGYVNTATASRSVTPPDAGVAPLVTALDRDLAFQHLRRALPTSVHGGRPFSLTNIKIIRHKPGRRCLIQYGLSVESDLRGRYQYDVLGKIRMRGTDLHTFLLSASLWKRGFDARSEDGISVPEPLALVPGLRMWVQAKVPGLPSMAHLEDKRDTETARRIADAACKLHQFPTETKRRHTMHDELVILHKRLGELMVARPDWEQRISRLLAECRRQADSIDSSTFVGIHRDFYPDQVLVDGNRLWLVDLDLHCLGDPALDIGNFLAHMKEHSLRERGDPAFLARQEQALVDRVVELYGEQIRPRIEVYALLSLARHVHISTTIPVRNAFTEDILALCEDRILASRQSR